MRSDRLTVIGYDSLMFSRLPQSDQASIREIAYVTHGFHLKKAGNRISQQSKMDSKTENSSVKSK